MRRGGGRGDKKRCLCLLFLHIASKLLHTKHPPPPPYTLDAGWRGPFALSISDPICQVLYAIKICNCFGFECCLFCIRGGKTGSAS